MQYFSRQSFAEGQNLVCRKILHFFFYDSMPSRAYIHPLSSFSKECFPLREGKPFVKRYGDYTFHYSADDVAADFNIYTEDKPILNPSKDIFPKFKFIGGVVS